ncbi:ribonuclease HII [Methylovirgula sp. 4M-Z18]|uniref:ribonuclease HII n=1 Tax=Methylovirgula sp. 4M-Z18 TaxID=2293567 RepID=UPI000E2E4768|nr:ribonuclease HII [Methylovirgula sp. 4M-Z18]RFB80193.1 ribonuclease HII [Methylovirgula sp. 4M-Z18]
MKQKSGPDFTREHALIARGFPLIAGVDEVGRGPLAGPVTAAAVILNPDDLPQGLDDSKKLSAKARVQLSDAIHAKALAVAVSFAPAAEIDRYNIRGAALLAMRRAIAALTRAPAHALIDGRDTPPGLSCPATAVIKGDALSLSIAAASIVAKVARDRLMERLDHFCPGYGMGQHAGYPTQKHRAAIAVLGPSGFHRMSFKLLSNEPPATI